MTNWLLAHFRHAGRAAVGLRDDRNGVTMLEYSLIGALIAAACVSAVTTLGTDISAMFGRVAASIAGHH